jgi:hypothetical protein
MSVIFRVNRIIVKLKLTERIITRKTRELSWLIDVIFRDRKK